MELRFKSLSIFKFRERYPDGDSCLSYLADHKWDDVFKCRKSGRGSYFRGCMPCSRQCTSCRYDESPKARTLFHKVKFDILTTFYIVYFRLDEQKSITSTELARKLALRQKTCWAFKQKVMNAMKSSGNHPIKGTAEVDGTKKLVLIDIEK